MRILVLLLVFSSSLWAQESFPRHITDNSQYKEALSIAQDNPNRLYKLANSLFDQYLFPERLPATAGYTMLTNSLADNALYFTTMGISMAPFDSYNTRSHYIASLLKGTDIEHKNAFDIYAFSLLIDNDQAELKRSLNELLNFYKSDSDITTRINADLNLLSVLKSNFQNGLTVGRQIFTASRSSNAITAQDLNRMYIELMTAHKAQSIPQVSYLYLLSELGYIASLYNIINADIKNVFETQLADKNSNPHTAFLLIHSFKPTYSERENQRLIEVLDVVLGYKKQLNTPKVLWLLNKKAKAYREIGNYSGFATTLEGIKPLLKNLKNPDLLIESYINLVVPEIANSTPLAQSYVQKMQQLIDKYPYLNNAYRKNVAALAIQSGMKDDSSSEAITAMDFYNRSMLALKTMDYQAMIEPLRKAQSLLEKERSNADALTLNDTEILYKQVLIQLAGSLIKVGKPEEALETAELIKNSELNRHLNINGNSSKTVKEIQATLTSDEALIYYLSPGSLDNSGYFNFLIKKNSVDAAFFDFTKFVAQIFTELPKMAAHVEDKLASKELRKANSTTRSSSVQNFDIRAGDTRIFFETYRAYLEANKEDQAYLEDGYFKKLSVRIWFSLFPNAKYLEGINKLVIIPTDELSFIPFETLYNPVNNHYLIEDYEISYAPSASTLVSLRQRKLGNYSKNVLAFGDAKYSLRANTSHKARSIADVKRLQLSVNKAIADGKNLDFAFGALQTDEPMTYLLGTKREVEDIEQLIPKTDTRTDKQMTENELKNMSASGALKDYKVLHIASHASVNPYIFDLSGIAMSVFPKPVDGEDGIVTVSEMKELDLSSELVMLSACQTGLGRLTIGDAVQGLNNSLFHAGAQATLTSLWSVNDYATSIFVKEFYKKVFLHNVPYSRAVNEVKRAFIRGDYGQNLTHPTYWSPFIYYGK